MHIAWSKSIHNKNLHSYKVLVISRLPDKAGILPMHVGLLFNYFDKKKCKHYSKMLWYMSKKLKDL